MDFCLNIGEKQFCLTARDGKLEAAAVAALKSKGKTLAFAESCTGGLASARIVDVPGASAVFLGGVVSYANSVKENLLGVKSETLRSFGAVSPQTAEEMALGVRHLTGADLAVSITGIAGPASDDTKKPIGLVYLGVASGDGVRTVMLQFGDRGRDEIRFLSAGRAIFEVLSACLDEESGTANPV